MIRAKAVALSLVGALLLSGCAFGGSEAAPTYKANFQRAIQVFPAVKVRILGVAVGHVIRVKNIRDFVQVEFEITDPAVKLPANVQAAVLPQSLLGERSIQLIPAYQGGPVFPHGGTIPISRTAVPAEPDEVLRSLQDYLGRLDPKVVTKFVENAAGALEGNGAAFNQTIRSAANVFRVLNAKRDDLAELFVQLNNLTLALSTRQQAMGELIRSYNAVVGTITRNRRALEGTIDGLRDAAVQLASLLDSHHNSIRQSVQNLTRTGRTLGRAENAFNLALTSKWAKSLFISAMPGNAVDWDHKWLRLQNQGEHLGDLITARIRQRLQDLCASMPGPPPCASSGFWTAEVSSLFAPPESSVSVPGVGELLPAKAEAEMKQAINEVPPLRAWFDARAKEQGTTFDAIVESLVQGIITNTSGLASTQLPLVP
ncbi:MAG TPA: MCE family protein [Actinomycetota bacterium]|nr:MCE family protein [Actinomycetota bacterium]